MFGVDADCGDPRLSRSTDTELLYIAQQISSLSSTHVPVLRSLFIAGEMWQEIETF